MDPRIIRHLQKQEAALVDLTNKVALMGKFIASGMRPGTSAQAIKSNIDSSVAANMRPGNLGELSQVIWPFWFTFTPGADVQPNSNVRTSISITQEAAFVWMNFTKAVFINSAGIYTYLDPENFNTNNSDASGLNFTIKDGSSSRSFVNQAMSIDHMGSPRDPCVLPTPVFLNPRQTIEIEYFNTDPALIYRPFITFFGYRIRLDDGQYANTVTG
jgi:hypothetical protein